MPFTAFHMGPGLALKGLLGSRFSLLAFGMAQVAMDVEPLVGLIQHAPILHGWSHTYLSAAIIGLACSWLAPPICRPVLHRWNRELKHYGYENRQTPGNISLSSAACGALLGTFSHVFLDSIMHSDIAPLLPFSQINPLHGIISITQLHWACIVSGALGVLLAWGLKNTD